jgi:hypothetical protein
MRNRLTLSQKEDLVYIYTNRKLLQKWHGTNPMAKYKKNMESKNSMDIW